MYAHPKTAGHAIEGGEGGWNSYHLEKAIFITLEGVESCVAPCREGLV
jgi:hypothetical protein